MPRSASLSRRFTGLLAALLATPAVVVAPAASAAVPSTSGTEFWVAFLENLRTIDALELFVASDVATTGTVSGGPLSAPITFDVAAGTVTTRASTAAGRSAWSSSGPEVRP